MPSPLGAFLRSPLGAFVRSPLGARDGGLEDEEDVAGSTVRWSGSMRVDHWRYRTVAFGAVDFIASHSAPATFSKTGVRLMLQSMIQPRSINSLTSGPRWRIGAANPGAAFSADDTLASHPGWVEHSGSYHWVRTGGGLYPPGGMQCFDSHTPVTDYEGTLRDREVITPSSDRVTAELWIRAAGFVYPGPVTSPGGFFLSMQLPRWDSAANDSSRHELFAMFPVTGIGNEHGGFIDATVTLELELL